MSCSWELWSACLHHLDEPGVEGVERLGSCVLCECVSVCGGAYLCMQPASCSLKCRDSEAFVSVCGLCSACACVGGCVHVVYLSVFTACVPHACVCVHTHMYMPDTNSWPGPVSAGMTPSLLPRCLSLPPSWCWRRVVISWSDIFICSKYPIAHIQLSNHRNGPQRRRLCRCLRRLGDLVSLLPISH